MTTTLRRASGGGGIINFPDPDVNNSQSRVGEVLTYKTIDDKLYAYAKTNDEVRLIYTWNRLTRGKIIELIEFLEVNIGYVLFLTDHSGSIHRVILTSTDPQFITERKARECVNQFEFGSVTLEFVGNVAF